MNLVTLRLEFTVSFSFVGPNDLLQLLSLMPQLEIFRLDATIPDGEAAEQVWRRSNTMHVTLPNLRWVSFTSLIAYLEALITHITAPLLDKVDLCYWDVMTYSTPRSIYEHNREHCQA